MDLLQAEKWGCLLGYPVLGDVDLLCEQGGVR